MTPFALPDYLIDAAQRGVMFLDLMRRRGNEEIRMAAHPAATVLRFAHEEIMSGRALARPMNYSLLRILPLSGGPADRAKRPIVVIDPRAGEGPGIGGFKAESEIGDALRAGHPVYFIGFNQQPVPGQTFLDVVEGQVRFFEKIVALHPDAPLPFAIGNCQAGYQTLMVAMLRPDLFGPCLMVGSPMSYWQGVHGKNPMRYTGGLLGGSWLTALTSDLGHGTFDGAWLVENFDALGPANWLWGKQYAVYAEIDKGGDRYLAFERWWGDFITMNGDELQFLVDNLFIGDKLTRNELAVDDGSMFDVRRVTSPIVVFASTGDNISPPPQALGWIADLYRDVDDIQAGGQTIVYCLDHDSGHLALFVSSKIGAEQDEEFVRTIDVIDCLPPGLFEMIVAPAPDRGSWTSRFAPRSIDDIRALGRNSPADDRAFAAVAHVSALNLAAYRAFLQPAVRALASQNTADLAQALHPLRLSYTMFADDKPWMSGIERLAASASGSRRPVLPDNPFLQWQTLVSDQIIATLSAYQTVRDGLMEQVFFGFYGSPFVQALLGIPSDSAARPPPGPSPKQKPWQVARSHAIAAKLGAGGFDAALVRAVLFIVGANHTLDERCAAALSGARHALPNLTLSAFKMLVRDQSGVLALDPVRAIAAVPSLVPSLEERRTVVRELRTIFETGNHPAGTEHLDRIVHQLTDPA